MGVAKAQKHEEREKKSKRGSVNNAARLGAFSKRKQHTGADWGGCNGERMQAVVVAITDLGGAITFGLSRDKGAHSITLMLDGERETMWYNGDAPLDEELDTVAAMLDAMKE